MSNLVVGQKVKAISKEALARDGIYDSLVQHGLMKPFVINHIFETHLGNRYALTRDGWKVSLGSLEAV